MCMHDPDLDTNLLKEAAKRQRKRRNTEKGLEDSFMVKVVLGSHLLSRQSNQGEGKVVWKSVPLHPRNHGYDCTAFAFSLFLNQQLNNLRTYQNHKQSNCKTYTGTNLEGEA